MVKIMSPLSHTRPPDLDIDDGLLEVARIFAEGVLRRHRQGKLQFSPDGLSFETPLEIALPGLEKSRKTRLSVTRS
jgi:hypothetical protein